MNCFRFPDRATFLDLAAAEGLVNDDETLITDSHTHCIDEIGVITRGGQWDPETGEVLEPPTVLEGHHVNTVGLAPEAWDEYLVVVNTPVRIFLGGPTQAPPTDVLEEIAQL